MTPKSQSVYFPRIEQLEGYLALPDRATDESYPGVVVVHEIFGLNENIRGVADRLAGEGYAALAVDLFAGRNRVVRAARFVGDMISNSLDHGGIRDLKSALTYLAGLEVVDEDRLGTIGFSLGGSLAVAWSCVDDRLKAAASYYGVNPRPPGNRRERLPGRGFLPRKRLYPGPGRAARKRAPPPRPAERHKSVPWDPPLVL